MRGCNIHNSVHDWRGNKLFHEQNEGNLFLLFSLYLLLSYASSSSCISCRIHSKSPYYMTAFTSPGPSCISSSSLPSPKCFQKHAPSPAGATLLPTFVALASQAQCLVPHCLSAPPGLSKELGVLCHLHQWGTPAMTLPGTDLEKNSLSLPVCQVCLKLAELSRMDRWMDYNSWLWQHD